MSEEHFYQFGHSSSHFVGFLVFYISFLYTNLYNTLLIVTTKSGLPVLNCLYINFPETFEINE